MNNQSMGDMISTLRKEKGKVVEVTFQKLKDGVISISNAWVK